MERYVDRTGQRLGRLIISEFVGYRTSGRGVRRAMWRCVCDCGGETTISSKTIAAKSAKSCGCLQKETVSRATTTHGKSRTRLYKVWTAMKSRCHHEGDPQYHHYGGRGIHVCDRWRQSFENFEHDVGERPSSKHSLDRIDNDKGYEPGNIRWATARQQLLNRRKSIKYEYEGEMLSCREISERSGMKYMTLHQRLKKGMTAYEAVNTPLDPRRTMNSHKRFAMSSDDSL